MTDVLTVDQRSLLMSRVRQRDTKPEMVVRRGLHARGLRYRLQDRKLPGRPDLVFSRHRTAVLVHGCFWHAHGCTLSKLPGTRQDFWREKLEANVARDHKAIVGLRAAGWRVLIVWECALRGPSKLDEAKILDEAAEFIKAGKVELLEIRGLTNQWKVSTADDVEPETDCGRLVRGDIG